jgi:membrane protein
VTGPLQRALAAYRRVVWDTDAAGRPFFASLGVRAVRLGQAVVTDLREGQLTLRAMSLVYTTLLSLVPLLAFAFSVLKGLGVHNQLQPVLLQFLAPLGENAEELTVQITGFVERVNVKVLGTVGVAFLIFTVLSLVHKVEDAFNAIWHIHRTRGLAQRFAGYLSVLLIGPFLVVAALGLTASLMSNTLVQQVLSIGPLGALVHLGARLAPYVMVTAAFTATYIFMPNTKVRPLAAFTGGLVAGLLWESVGWMFGAFVVGSTKYTAIYSGFAILILFMVWVFLCWLILLVGAAVAFYVQHPEYQRTRGQKVHVSQKVRERLALLVMFAVGRRHLEDTAPWTGDALGRSLRVPADVLDEVVRALEAHALLLATGDEPPAYVPARDLGHIPLADVVEAVREAGDAVDYPVPAEAAVDRVLERLGAARAQSLAGATVRDMVAGGGADAPSARAGTSP